MTANRIPAGLLDMNTEFFTVVKESKPTAMCLFGGKPYDFNSTPECRKEIVRSAMKANPVKERAMEMMVGMDEDIKLEKYIMCNYGALNDDADIDVSGNLSEPEYVPCKNRSTCEFAGKGCNHINVDGIALSPAQSRVFELAKYENKKIAEKLFLSVETVKKHMQTIQITTGLNGKAEMIHWATIKGII